MIDINTASESEKMEQIDKLFQETILSLKALHEEKLNLIKKFRQEGNLLELNKIRESLKG